MTKKSYRVSNWSYYNKALVNRGSITFWFSEECIKEWHSTDLTGKRGRPEKYNSLAIECGLTLKALLKLTFRSTEGFIKSLVDLMQLNIEVPDYSLLCKRQRTLEVKLPKKPDSEGEKLNILVDSTGLKVFGEGEWKVRQHGVMKKRLWRKLHIALNSDNQEIEAFQLTDLGTQDFEGFERLIADIESELDKVIGDGAYDRFPCYKLATEKGFDFITPPQRNARTSEERKKKISKAKRGFLKDRDAAIQGVREKGRKDWKIEIGYHRRSLVETLMFRIKTILGSRLSARLFDNQKVEARIWCKIINHMTKIGMPISYVVEN
jgi:hypothetical protein